jgi:hypothetical protein
MIYETAREGHIDEYHDVRRAALTSPRGPPPRAEDTKQLKEAYIDNDGSYDFDHLERNPIRRALCFWSDSLYTGNQLSIVMSTLVPSYNNFEAPETIEMLVDFFPEAFFCPAREYSVAIYVFSNNGASLNLPTEEEQARLKVDECSFYPPRTIEGITSGIIRLWWD